MILRDEEEFKIKTAQNKKVKTIIIILIILLLMLCMIIGVLAMYRVYNPTQITTYIDGKVIPDFDKILDFQTDENGKTQIYVPIREFATYLNSANAEFGYRTYKGEYNPKTEEENKCYTIRDDYEVAIYTENSKIIYKVDLQDKSSEYEETYIDKNVFMSDGKLYTSVDGIEKGYNVYFSYDETKKNITINTLDYLISSYEQKLQDKPIGEYGIMTLADDRYSNWKSVFDDLLIVKNEQDEYGIMKASDYSFVLEPQYDNIEFITNSSTFLVESDKKVGLFSEEGKRKIDLLYDEITLIGREPNLYLIKTNNQYGVVDENGKIIIYPQYEKIGIDVSNYSYNGVKNGYILLDELIPVCQNKKWAFFNKKGENVTKNFKYEDIGCSSVRTENNLYPLLEIPEKKVLVVENENKKYSFMDINGNDSMLPFVFDEIYIKVNSGKNSYWMLNKEKEYEVLNYLK